MLLGVFSGIAMFGFFGIILGPVLIVMIVTTILGVSVGVQGVAMEAAGTEVRKKRLRRNPEAGTAACRARVEPGSSELAA